MKLSKRYTPAERELITGYLDQMIAHAKTSVDALKQSDPSKRPTFIRNNIVHWTKVGQSFRWARALLNPKPRSKPSENDE